MNQSLISFWLTEFDPFTTAIVANGEVPSSELSIRLLRKMKRIICCDGAIQKLLSINIIPDVIVGDGDSMDREELSRHNIPYHADRSEEYNDLQKALKYCMANGYNDVLLLGCGGLREDHFIANLSIMVMYSEKMRLAMLTEHGVFNVMRGTSMFRSVPGMQVSVFPSNLHTKLSFSGLKYPVNDRSFNWLWEGSLNESVGIAFTVEADGGEPVVLYRTL
ncbi:MAG: thiamine diphosphokinase [Bacteroidales bacterium]|nr:thiamine diphosphokinase [Bacteroidales bacterium]